MTSFTYTVNDGGVQQALRALSTRFNDLQPVLQGIGEGIVERTKHRFDTSTGPDGVAWQANSAATLAMLARRLGKSYRKKDGALNKKGVERLAAKKPLIGESGDLRRQIVAVASGSELVVSATPIYAAMQHFGGTTSPSSWIPNAKIPARPFMPIMQDGSLYPSEAAAIIDALNDYLSAPA